MMAVVEPWGGNLHQIVEEPFPSEFCFECGDMLRKDDYVHVHFGGMVIIHCKCSHAAEVEYADAPPVKSMPLRPNLYVFQHPVDPPPISIELPQPPYDAIDFELCTTHRPEPICACGKFVLDWRWELRAV